MVNVTFDLAVLQLNRGHKTELAGAPRASQKLSTVKKTVKTNVALSFFNKKKSVNAMGPQIQLINETNDTY